MTDSNAPNDPLALDPPMHEYSWDFDYGMGPWTTWLAPSVVQEAGGQYESFTRLNAPGWLDPNHVEGIGALRLIAHLSIPVVGSPGALNLTDAEFEITMRATDFDAHGGRLMVWLCRYIPEEGVLRNYYVGLAVTNWANTGNDLTPQLVEDEWVTLTVHLSSDPADWTYAGENRYLQGETADRYQPFDLGQTLADTNATLHLVMVNDEEDEYPTGFLDIANITVRTNEPATPVGSAGDDPNRELFYGVEDKVITGTLAGDGVVDLQNATFSLVAGSAVNGSVTIDPSTGAFVWTPNPNHFGPTDFVGAATFRYTVTDGLNTSAERTAFFFIGGINDAPTTNASDESFEIAADASFDFTLLKGADVDRDERLTFRLVDGSATNGTVVLDQTNGHYVFTPTAGFSGQASFTYLVSDGQLDSDPKTVVLTVVPPGAEPARPSYQDAVDALTSGNTEAFVRAVMLAAQAGEVWAADHFGTWLRYGQNVTADAARAVPFLELASAAPAIKLILAEMYVTGNGVERDYARAHALLAEMPADPTAVFKLGVLHDRGLGVPEDHALALQFYIQSARMGSGDGALAAGRRYLMGDGVGISPTDVYFWLAVALKSGFTASTIPQFVDLVTFNLNQAAEGLAPGERAVLDAAAAAWSPGQAPPVNDAPVAGEAAGTVTGSSNSPIAGTLTEGTDVDGDALTYSLVGGSVEHGVVVIDARTGAYVFTPAGGYAGPASFRYVVTDGYANSAETTVNLVFAPVTAAVADANALNEAASLTVGAGAGLLANDSVSAAGGAIQVDSVNDQPASVGQSVAGAYGSITINADGSYTYVADGSTAALLQGQTAIDSFTYTIIDGENVTRTATLTITVNGVGGTVLAGSGVVIGSALDDLITGGNEADVLAGQGGDDVIAGGDGAPNEIYGGLGDDTFIVSLTGDTIIENPGEGVDTVQTALSAYTLRAEIENLIFTGEGGFEGIGNESANLIRGGAGDDTLSGLGGDDILDGGAGSDLMAGGVGDDIYIVAGSGDIVDEAAGEGTDTIRTSLSALQLAANVENLIYIGSGDFRGAGNALNNIIAGGAGDDVLSGGAGVDVINGGLGIDTVDYSAAASAVRAQLNSNASTMDGDGGADTFSGIENLTGSAFNDILIGDGNANVLRGGLGADTLLGLVGDDVLWGGAGALNTLQGGLGDDVYVLEAADTVFENFGEGTDTVDARINTYILANNVENLLFGGTGNFAGTGNALANVITGGGGDDVLRGGGGADVMHGGLGSDTVDYGLAAAGVVARLDSQRATNDGDGATDTFTSIENLTGSIHDDVLLGDNNANILMGGVGRDVLAGFGGDDILRGGSGGGNNELIGGTGDDWYVLDAFDSCVELAGEGIDTVEARVGSYTLGANLENLLYTGPGKFVGNGNALDNVITGGAHDDMLRGRGGSDIIYGGEGVDEVQFTGTTAEYAVSVEGAGYRIIDTVADRDGTTYVESIERLRFLNGNTTTSLSYPPPAPGALEPTVKGGDFSGPLGSSLSGDPRIPPGADDDAFVASSDFDGPQVLPAAFDDGLFLGRPVLGENGLRALIPMFGESGDPRIVDGPNGLHLQHDRLDDHHGYGPGPWS